MNQRQKQVLSCLVEHDDFMTVQSLADQFMVSLRTMHNDIREIEKFLFEHHITFIKKPKVGVKIDAPLAKRKPLLNLINLRREPVDILSTKMRRMKIFAQLLTHNQGSSLNKLSDEFMVSKTSIVGDLEIIERKAAEFDLVMIRDRKGTRVEGEESNIRHALSHLTSDFLQLEFAEENQEEKASRLDLSTYYRLKNIFDMEHIEIIEEIIVEAEEKLGYMINELSYVNLITHLLILIKRLKKTNGYTWEEANKVFSANTNDDIYHIAQYIAKKISDFLDIDIPDSEIVYIYQYLVCSGIQSDFLHLNIESYALDIKDEYKDTIEQMISFVSDSTHCDLRHDKELKLSLMTHIIPLVQRIKYNIKIDNPLINEIKMQYSAMFSIVTMAVEMVDMSDLHHICEDEIGFLTIHFQAAIERAMQQKNVIIVCPEGIGFSRLIAHRIERFVSSVSIVDIVSLNQLKHMNLDNIDLVISTVPIKECQKTVIVVSSFISETDIRGINNFLVENAQNQENHCFEHLAQIIDESVIHVGLEFQKKEEILQYLCDELQKAGYVSENYFQSVLARENIMATDLGNQIAIPHGSEKEIIESKIAIATLKKPIVWNQHQVQIVFMIAMNMKNPQRTKNILKDLYSVMDSKRTLALMLQAKTKKDVLHILKD